MEKLEERLSTALVLGTQDVKGKMSVEDNDLLSIRPQTAVGTPRLSDTAITESETPLQRAYRMQESSILFGRCPGEIRNKIYEYLLITDEEIDHRQMRCVSSMKSVVPGGQIVRTCRAVLCESYPILYGRNIFSFTHRCNMIHFQMVYGKRTASKQGCLLISLTI